MSLEHLQLNLDQLKKGIESKVAILESDTVSEIRMSKKAISSIDKNLEQRFEIFIQKFQQTYRDDASRLLTLVMELQILKSNFSGPDSEPIWFWITL